MTKKQVDDFSKCCDAWIDAYCTDNHCSPEDIPLRWAVETAEMHLDNLECRSEYWDMYDKADYKGAKAFLKKYANVRF